MQSSYQLNHQPIFVLGFMGSGKTYWGRQWAQQLNIPFSDLDQVVEANASMSVADIFEKRGEDYFREQETAALRNTEKSVALISCGGGTPCFNNNMNWMNENGLTIFLEGSPRFLLDNILKEPHVRPLTRNMNEAELLFFIEAKLKQRNSFYRQAKMILPAAEVDIESLNHLITI